MTVDDVIDQFTNLKKHGLNGSDKVVAFNGDTNQMEEVTGFLYGGNDGILEICTDEA